MKLPTLRKRPRLTLDSVSDLRPIATWLVVNEAAEKVAARLGTTTVSKSGWYVYNNMEQVLGKKVIAESDCPYNYSCYPCQREYRKGMVPRTDDLLARAIDISVGVVDKGLGSAFGIHSRSTDTEVDQKVKEFTAALRESV